MPKYYTNLLYFWIDKENNRVYALMSKRNKWFFVERIFTKRLGLKGIYKINIKIIDKYYKVE